MVHSQIITPRELEEFADSRLSEEIIPELVYLLVTRSVKKILECRIPYGDAINQEGFDGFVKSLDSFFEFVPQGESYWEIGTGKGPQKKATIDFKKRTNQIEENDRKRSTFVFVTPRSSGPDGWDITRQSKWKAKRKDKGWGAIKIIDGVKLADWLRELPALGRWMLQKTGRTKSQSGLKTVGEHWKTFQNQLPDSDPPIPPSTFLIGRDHAITALEYLFEGKTNRLLLFAESVMDVTDFVSAYIFSLDSALLGNYANRCLFISEKDTWLSIAAIRRAHILVADPRLGLETDEGADLQAVATNGGHAVIIPICNAFSRGNHEIVRLKSPTKRQLEAVFGEAGYTYSRAKTLAEIGADRLSSLRRYFLGLESLPPYANWETANLLAKIGLAGKWDWNNSEDRRILEILLGKEYGEWIETIREDTLKLDSPLVQQNEKWWVISRGEAWTSLGSRISDSDLENFRKVAIEVLGETDPQFDLPPEKRLYAPILGKKFKFSMQLREGIAESIALLGSRPKELASCSLHKPIDTAILILRSLLSDSSWIKWASLDSLLPLLAEGSPEEFLRSLEELLEGRKPNPFIEIFNQEVSDTNGGSIHHCGLLWALETLAWHPDYLARVTLILGELASIDPGGKSAHRPSNSLTDIFLPWHPQTCATVEKRISAIAALTNENPEVSWELLISLLPQHYASTFGSHRPIWRNLIGNKWDDSVSLKDYEVQTMAYAQMALTEAKNDPGKLITLAKNITILPSEVIDNFLAYFHSETVSQFSDREKYHLWQVIDEIIHRHRKYADCDWAFPTPILEKLSKAIAIIEPQSEIYKCIHLFEPKDIDQYDGNGSIQEQVERLLGLQKNAIFSLFSTSGIGGVIKLVNKVSSPILVGNCLGGVTDKHLDSKILPTMLLEKDSPKSQFAQGFVQGRFFEFGWEWVDLILINEWKRIEKALLLSILPFQNDTWKRVECFLGSEEGLYWERANTWTGKPIEIRTPVEKLNKYGRGNAAIAIILRFGQNSFDSGLAIKALQASLQPGCLQREFNHNNTITLITLLQKQSSTDQEVLFQLEWKLLPLLREYSCGSPKTLLNRISSDPTFFCELIVIVYKSEFDKKNDQILNDDERFYIRLASQLLNQWKTPPGMSESEEFHPSFFEDWTKKAIEIAKSSGHLESALRRLGEVLIYSPVDDSGLWIHKAVAKVLNEKKSKSMRDGFTNAILNSRGVFSYSAGKEELKLSDSYKQKADSLDSFGFTRLAADLRHVSDTYSRRADQEAQRELDR